MSLRSFARFGASVAVLRFGLLGSSLSLRSFSRLGATVAVQGITRLSSSLSLSSNLCVSNESQVHLPSWTVSYDMYASQYSIVHDATSNEPLAITGDPGGHLAGSWSTEAILSTSDRRLKEDIEPLHRSLRAGLLQKATAAAPMPVALQQPWAPASWLLRQLKPRRIPSGGAQVRAAPVPAGHQDARAVASNAPAARFGFDAEELRQVLPEVVRPQPQTGKLMMQHEDLLAVLTQAAQEQQQALEEQEAREREEEELLASQDALIQAMEQQLKALRGRFLRLRSRSPVPPPERGAATRPRGRSASRLQQHEQKGRHEEQTL